MKKLFDNCQRPLLISSERESNALTIKMKDSTAMLCWQWSRYFLMQWLFPIFFIMISGRYIVGEPLDTKLFSADWPPVWQIGVGISVYLAIQYRHQLFYKTLLRNLFFSLFTVQWICLRSQITKQYTVPHGTSLLLALAAQTILVPWEIVWTHQQQAYAPIWLRFISKYYDYFATLLLAVAYGPYVDQDELSTEWIKFHSLMVVRQVFAIRILCALLPMVWYRLRERRAELLMQKSRLAYR